MIGVAFASTSALAPIEFSRAEVQFFFQAPISRRQLLHYKLLRSQLALIFGTAFATIIGMFIVNGLPMHYHPVLKYDHIRRGMDDTFFIVIEAKDPRFNLANTKALLEKVGGKAITELEP